MHGNGITVDIHVLQPVKVAASWSKCAEGKLRASEKLQSVPSLCRSSSLLFQPAVRGSKPKLQERFFQGGGDRKQDKPAPSASATKLSKDSHLLTVTVPEDSTKRQVEHPHSPHRKHTRKGRAAGKGSKKKSE